MWGSSFSAVEKDPRPGRKGANPIISPSQITMWYQHSVDNLLSGFLGIK